MTSTFEPTGFWSPSLFSLFREQFATLMQGPKGYTTAELYSISIKETSVTLTCTLCDDFQEDIPDESRFQHGAWQTLNVSNYSELVDRLLAWPSREKREQAVLARRFAGLGEMKKHLQSATARKFVEEMLAESQRFALLNGPEAMPAPHPLSDMPF